MPRVPREYRRPRGAYRRVRAPLHPLAKASGIVGEHRIVLFARIGYGPHRCHWCGVSVQWGVNLDTDHLNGQPNDNDSGNLVESCPPCNTTRGMAMRAEAYRKEVLAQSA